MGFFLLLETFSETSHPDNQGLAVYIILNFPALDFLVGRIKELENKKNLSAILYPIFIHSLPLTTSVEN